MDQGFAELYARWTTEARYGSPLVDHLPRVSGVPSPNEVLGHHIGAPKTLTYYEDILRYYRALADATPRVQVETIGQSDEGRELVVVWVSSDENMAGLAENRRNLGHIADPRGLSEGEIQRILDTTKPHYHVMGGLHSGETGSPEMLMELVYRLATETSPFITRIRDNVFVSVTPVADPDGRDRVVDWFYRGLEREAEKTEEEAAKAKEEAAKAQAEGEETPADSAAAGEGEEGEDRVRPLSVPYWGKYVLHDNNRDINLSQVSMRALTDWYFTAFPPIMHDLHESGTLLYTYSGGPPQNPNLDPVLFGELAWFSNWEMSQMAKWNMPGVYTHAFMDAWSPGYLGSVAYNHNGLMRMYETQSPRDVDVDSLQAARESEEEAAEEDTDSTDLVRATRYMGAPTGRGGAQLREWYRGYPVPEDAVETFTRRQNVNYMETGVLSALQLTALSPRAILENFYIKTRNSIEAGRAEPPFGYVIPVQRDMTRVVRLVEVLRAQGIEVGRLNREVTVGEGTFPEGSYLVKLDQPYGRLAKNLLEVQHYPDPELRTYDDSGWTMGYAFDAEVQEIQDRGILDARVTPVDVAVFEGEARGGGSAALAVAHLGSTNMITFRYRLKDLEMQITEEPFSAEDTAFPAGSFLVTGSQEELDRARAEAVALGLTAAELQEVPDVRSHDGDAPRVAIYSQWQGTQEIGWYRHAFDQFEIPFDLIYKERVEWGNLRGQYDVIVMAVQDVSRESVLAPAAERPEPYQQSEKYRFLGMYGETPDMTGGFGEDGVRAFESFLDRGGTLIAAGRAVRFPIEFGFARTVDTEPPEGVGAQKPLVQAVISNRDHPVFYGFADSIFPVKYDRGVGVFRVGVADEDRVLARYVGGEAAVLSGLMTGADNLAGRAFVVDSRNAFNGKGRVLMFANNPIYRWQNHGEFNLVFNSILNWNDVPDREREEMVSERERPAMMECPWEMPAEDRGPQQAGARRSIPDCYPPGWEAPAELEPYQPRPLPEDRANPVVDDYLDYVVQAPPLEVVERFDLDTAYYKKWADASGYPILASEEVPDEALAIVRDQVNYMLGNRPDVRDTLIAHGGRIVIMAETEYTMDIPEQRDWTVPKYLDPRLTEGERNGYYEEGGLGYRSPEGYWNGRARGMGGTLTSCAEENVLGYYGTRYWGSNICVHEFSHAIMGAGIANADPYWFQEIVNAYKKAKEQGLPTAQGYAGNTFNEYWAVGVERYVGSGGIQRRAELKEIDPILYELVSRLIPEGHFLPATANVANRTREELDEYVRSRNPEWWVREQERQRRRGGGGGDSPLPEPGAGGMPNPGAGGMPDPGTGNLPAPGHGG